MCGIVGAVSNRPVCEILVDGLQRLEYRGYDSAGVTILDCQGHASCVKRQGKVEALVSVHCRIRRSMALQALPIPGGPPMVLPLSATPTRTNLASVFPWCITVLSKITTNCAMR